MSKQNGVRRLGRRTAKQSPSCFFNQIPAPSTIEQLEKRVLLSVALRAPAYYPTGDGAKFVTAADLTGNGINDLLVVNEQGDSVSVLLGNGNGTFQPQETYAVGNDPQSVAVA